MTLSCSGQTITGETSVDYPQPMNAIALVALVSTTTSVRRVFGICGQVLTQWLDYVGDPRDYKVDHRIAHVLVVRSYLRFSVGQCTRACEGSSVGCLLVQ